MAGDKNKDEQLMLRYRNGDCHAFEILYERYRPMLFRHLARQCRNSAVAEELFQDIWLNIIRSRERYEVTASFKTYLFRLAHNRLIDYYRKESRSLPHSFVDPLESSEAVAGESTITPDRTLHSNQQLEKLNKLIGALPEAQREAFLMKEEAGLSLDEIAQITDVPVETAKSRVRYAFNKLRKEMDL